MKSTSNQKTTNKNLICIISVMLDIVAQLKDKESEIICYIIKMPKIEQKRMLESLFFGILYYIVNHYFHETHILK